MNGLSLGEWLGSLIPTLSMARAALNLLFPDGKGDPEDQVGQLWCRSCRYHLVMDTDGRLTLSP